MCFGSLYCGLEAALWNIKKIFMLYLSLLCQLNGMVNFWFLGMQAGVNRERKKLITSNFIFLRWGRFWLE
jgi:hypothetical protein